MLEAQVQQLRTQVDSLREEENENRENIGKQATFLASISDKQAEPHEYIMWHTVKYLGAYLVNNPKPTPLYSYDSKSECMAVVASDVKQYGGDLGTATYATVANGGKDIHTLSCLPKGVDPR
ncbi:hypothetical protein GCM10025793_07510 [Lysobacter lycopersici]